mmetsp:Transcript_60019/g.107905  ORF Transcript_60019/g.107905 Transcript_60019/m.107905 type:complete len:761 (+) Transcript_60019:113-2395(+)
MADSAPSDRILTETSRAPHNAVKAEKLSVFLGSKCLLSNAELKIAEQPNCLGTSFGLVGCNGCGKSTMLRLMAQRKLPIPDNWDVFLVGQQLPLPGHHAAVEEVLAAAPKRNALLARVSQLSEQLEQLESGEQLAELSEELAKVHVELADWKNARSEVEHVMQHLGFASTDAPSTSTPMNQLSGGWRMKVELAKAIWLKPRLLLLDEPTNHLDFHACQWLAQQLTEYPYTTVVVSHDVSFLHEVCKDIIWMVEQRLDVLPKEVVSQEELLRMQRRKPLRFDFRVPADEDPVAHGISLHSVEFAHSEEATLRVDSIRLSGRSRAVLLGKNGGGKSTFLELCAGLRTPGRGTVDRTPGLRVGYFSQLTEELDALANTTAAEFLLEQCWEELALHAASTHSSRLRAAYTRQTQSKDENDRKAARVEEKRLLEVARGVLSNYGFEGDLAVKVPVSNLSGGQKACLKFAMLSLRPAHILVLDEPTNHLDAEACRALADALANFAGGLLVVTHDDLLIYRLIYCNWNSSELLLCRNGCVWNQRHFSSHSLKAFQEVLRREEALARPALPKPKSTKPPKQAVPQDNPRVPPWLQGLRRGAHSDQSETKARAPVPPPVPPAPAPPWLRGPKRNQANQKAESAPPPAEPPKPPPKPPPPPLVRPLRSSEVPQRSCMSTRVASAPEDVETPESWEDLDTVSTEAPASEEDVGSRFHKDLQNLKKAVCKWQKRGAADIVQQIKSSKAAQQLRKRHGASFDESRFVQDLLSR